MADPVVKTKTSLAQTPPLGMAKAGASADGENSFAQFIRALMQMLQQGFSPFSSETAISGGDEAIKKLQGELAEQGFYPKTGKFAQDGIVGEVTRHALRLRDEPGFAEQHMRTALQGDKLSASDIMRVQASLNKLGYNVGNVDGRMNNETRDDIKRYLKDNPNVAASPGILEDSEQRSGFSRFMHNLKEKFQAGSDYVFTPSAGGVAGRLKDLITRHESGGNYNARLGAANGDGTQFTNMTINEVRQWQRNFVRQGAESGAVGRYQIIGTTLDSLVKEMGLRGNEKFDVAMQDRMGDVLLERRGLKDYIAGKISAEQFAKNVSKEWASMPKDESGKSYYAGVGSNRALTSHSSVMAAIRDIKTPPAQVTAEKPNDVDFSRPVTPTGKGVEGVTPVAPAFSRAANDAAFDTAAQGAKPEPVAQTARVSNGAPAPII